MQQQTVLIVTDQAGFARDVVGHWQMERTVPAFTLVSSELSHSAFSGPFQAAIVCPLNAARTAEVVKQLDELGAPAICVADDSVVHALLRTGFPRVIALRQSEDWVASVVLIAAEVLRRVEAIARARRAEAALVASERNAALGRFMLEARHGFNNALTSVLGNAELLILEPEAVPEHMREQIDTIHNMALKLHEMMQRFSSLEAELKFADKQSELENRAQAQAYVAGS